MPTLLRILLVIVLGVFCCAPSSNSAHGGARERYYAPFMSLAEGILYSPLPHGKLVAVEVRTRSVLWAYENPAIRLYAGPIHSDGRVIFAAVDNSSRSKLIALDQRRGVLLWEVFVGEPQTNPIPVLCGSRVVTSEAKAGSIIAVASASGFVDWRLSAEEKYFYNPPDVSDEGAVFAFGLRSGEPEGGIAIVDCETGRIRREIATKGVGMSRRPVIVHGSGALISRNLPHAQGGELKLLNLLTGSTVWENKFASPVSRNVEVLGNRLLFGSREFVVVDLETGKLIPRYRGKEPVESFALIGHTVVIHNGADVMLAFDLDSGKRLWRIRLPAMISSNLLDCHGVICIQTDGQRLLFLDLHTGRMTGEIRLAKE